MSTYPLRTITRSQRQVITRYVWWLTLECGHEVRIAGPTPPKKRARCYRCWAAADAAALVYYAACWSCGDEPTTPSYSRGQHKTVRLSTRLRDVAGAEADRAEHLLEHPGHKTVTMRERTSTPADLAAAATNGR